MPPSSAPASPASSLLGGNPPETTIPHYAIIWNAFHNDGESVIKKIYISDHFDYYQKNVLCIEKLNKKTETLDLILHNRLAIVKSNNSKDVVDLSIDNEEK